MQGATAVEIVRSDCNGRHASPYIIQPEYPFKLLFEYLPRIVNKHKDKPFNNYLLMT